MALLLQLYLISMINYVCFIFKSWPTSCCGTSKGWSTAASRSVCRCPGHAGQLCCSLNLCRAGHHSDLVFPPSWMLSWFQVTGRICTWLLCAEARRAVALGVRPVCCTVQPSASPHTVKPHDGFCEKNTQCFYYTCNFPVLYFKRKLF